MVVNVVHLTSDDLLVKCPRCWHWPMSATSVSPLAPHRILFTCGTCREQAMVKVPARRQRESQDAA